MDVLFEARQDDIVLKVYQDEQPESPREWDNLGTMVCFHRRYDLGDKHNYDSPEEFDVKDKGIAVILPLYLYDHSGISMSTSKVYPYNDRWDAGQVGWIYVSKEDIRKEYSVKNISKKTLEKAIRVLVGEVEAYDTYLRGNVYGFTLERITECPECGHEVIEDIDSCWGFYGDIGECGIEDHVTEYPIILEELKSA